MMADIKYKQFVIVPKRPRMSPGKIASQVAHATFMALEKYIKTSKYYLIDKWKTNGQCVIVLQCKDSTQLLSIAKYLEQWNIGHHLYIDEGLTEVEPFTPTCLATRIITEDEFWMFEKLELYK
jgi:peptidyl-tRNA hydrolase